MRTLKLSAAAMVAVALTLAGCSGGGSDAPASGEESSGAAGSGGAGTVQIISHLTLDNGGMQQVIDAFEKEYPDIKVELESVPFSDLNSVIDARVGQKNGSVDLYWADQPRVASLAARGYLQDLTGDLEDKSSVWDAASKEASSYDGKIYAAPVATSTQVLFYNKDLLDKAGVEAPSTDPAKRITWEQLATDAKTAQEKGGAKWGFMFGQFDRYYQLQPLLMEKGGPTGVGTDGLTPDVSSDAWVKAMEWYKSIFDDETAPRGEAEMQTEFLAGNTAYIQQGTWLIDALEAEADFNWGVALNPTFEGTEPITPTGSWSIGMSPFTDDKAAALTFLEWATTTDGGQLSVHSPEPDLPATEQGRETYFKRDVFQTPQGEDCKEIMSYELENTAVPRPSTVGYVEFEEVLNRAFADIRNGADPKPTLESAGTQLQTAWAAYK